MNPLKLTFLPLLLFYNFFAFGQAAIAKFDKALRYHHAQFETVNGEKVHGNIRIQCAAPAEVTLKLTEMKYKHYKPKEVTYLVLDSAEFFYLGKVSFYTDNGMVRTLPQKCYAMLASRGKVDCYIANYTVVVGNNGNGISRYNYILKNAAGDMLVIPGFHFVSKIRLRQLQDQIFDFCGKDERVREKIDSLDNNFRGLPELIGEFNGFEK